MAEAVISALVGFGAGAVIAGLVVFFILKYFLPGYLAEKGKNLATKEDVVEITDKVESVKSDYAKIIEEVRADNQFKLAEVEREKNLKKEVYMESVGGLVRQVSIIASLADLNISDKVFTDDIAKDSALIAKIQVVGGEETVKAVTEIQSEVGTAIFELLLERYALTQRKSEITTLELLRDKASNKMNELLAMMESFNISGDTDNHRWDVINKSYVFQQKQYDSRVDEISKLDGIQTNENIAYMKKCTDKFFSISSIFPNAILAVRKELDLEISDDAYIDIYNAHMDTGKKVFSEFMDKVYELADDESGD